MKRMLLIMTLMIVVFAGPVSRISKVSAHRSGCHRWHSCESDRGTYVCGDTGYTSGCSTYVAPRAPVITSKNLTAIEDIPFTDEVQYDSHEYPEYSKVTQLGEIGKTEASTSVTFTDGEETGRSTPTRLTKAQPKSKITVKGSRVKPAATLDSISKTKKRGKFDISGTYKPNSEVVISINDHKIKRAKTDSNGKFTFRGIKIENNDNELKIYNRENRKESQISELTYLNLSLNKLTTEYQKLHKHS